MSELKITVAEALILKPGDRVLLRVDRWTPDVLADAKERLAERFPGVEFTFINGVESISVQPDSAA